MKFGKKNINLEEEHSQEDIYASYEKKENNVPNNNVTNNDMLDKYQYKGDGHKDNYLETHSVVTRASKASRLILIGFYLLIILIAIVVYLLLRSDRYAFYVSKNEVNVSSGSSYQIEITPKNARYFSYMNYNYKTDDANIATVDEFGNITGVSAGTTNLRISLSPGLTSKSVRVNVEDTPIESISLVLCKDDEKKKVDTIDMEVNQTYTLKARANDRDDLYIDVEYDSSDIDVVIVDEYGNITAVGSGTATITGRRNDVEGSVVIKVKESSSVNPGSNDDDNPVIIPPKEVKVTSVVLNKNSIVLKINENETLSALVVPSNATNANVTWKSSNTSVATVNESGIVEALKEGTTTITVTTVDGAKTATCQVTVKKDAPQTVSVTGVSLNKATLSLDVNKNENLSAVINPNNATNKDVKWSSSDTSVVTVSNSGVVKGIKDGTATITVTTVDGSKTASCKVTVVTPIVGVTGVSLNKSAMTLNVNGSESLSETIYPNNATNTNVTWKSSDTSVAMVSNSGVVKAMKKGTVTITVTTVDGSKTATCQVTVNEPLPETVKVTGVTLNKTTLNLDVNKNETLNATVNPSNATNKNVTWKSSNTSIATVSASGVVKGIKDGTATITVTTADGSKTATCQVTVKTPVVKVTGVSLNKTTLNLNVNDSESLNANVSPNNATNTNVTWKSSNASIATVSASGVVKGVKAGTATITVTTADGSKTATCQVTVKTPVVKVTGVSLDKTALSLEVNKSATLKATISPSNATNTNVTWKSSNTSIATVSASGVVKGIKAGTATITVTTADGSKTATCKVTVAASTVKVTGVTLNKTGLSLSKDKSETLTATISPSNATNKTVTWKSSDTSIATVSTSGVVKGVKAGTATITVTTADGSKTATCKVTVTASTVKVTGIKIDTSGPIKKKVNETIQLSATISPSNATNKNVTWSSKDTKVATVDSKGKVTAVGKGETTITVTTADGGKTSSIQIQVSAVEQVAPTGTQVSAKEVTVSKTSLTVDKGKTGTFDIKVTGAAGLISVTSSNSNVVKISTSASDCNGLKCFFDAQTGKESSITYTITGVSAGTAYINVSLDDLVSYDDKTITGTGKIGILVK